MFIRAMVVGRSRIRAAERTAPSVAIFDTG